MPLQKFSSGCVTLHSIPMLISNSWQGYCKDIEHAILIKNYFYSTFFSLLRRFLEYFKTLLSLFRKLQYITCTYNQIKVHNSFHLPLKYNDSTVMCSSCLKSHCRSAQTALSGTESEECNIQLKLQGKVGGFYTGAWPLHHSDSYTSWIKEDWSSLHYPAYEFSRQKSYCLIPPFGASPRMKTVDPVLYP